MLIFGQNSILMQWVGTFVIKKTYWGNKKQFLKFEDQSLKSQDDQMWAKMQFWSHNSTLMYQVATFVNWKHLFNIGAELSNSENFKSKGQGHYMTKGQKSYTVFTRV